MPIDQPAAAGVARPSLPSVPSRTAFPLTIVAEIDSIFDGEWLTWGDTDRDGLPEFIGMDLEQPTQWRTVIAERQPDNTYNAHYPLPPGYLLPWATGDLDGDFKMEIIGQNGSTIVVYESVEIGGFPSTLVWTSPPLSSIFGYSTVADSDGDGRMEIIHSQNGGTARLVIFECRGDDSYSQVFNSPTPGNRSSAEKVILDLDQDGRMEIAVCGNGSGNGGLLYIFESTKDDEWQQVWIDSTGLFNAYTAKGGTDSDGNGRPELFIRGNDFSVFPPVTWPARVYEATDDNEFELVTIIPVPGSGGGSPSDAYGDLDGDGHYEYVARESGSAADPGALWVYAASSESVWLPIASIDDPEHSMGLTLTVNMNGNAKSEVVVAPNGLGFQTTRVWEYQPTSDARTAPRTVLSVVPNPASGVTRICWSQPALAPAALVVHDVRGRLVTQLEARGGWLEWRPTNIPGGVYFLRLIDASGASQGTSRVTVVPTK